MLMWENAFPFRQLLLAPRREMFLPILHLARRQHRYRLTELRKFLVGESNTETADQQ